MYRSLTQLSSFVMVALGVVLIVRTLMHGFGVGVVLGVLFIAAGGGRLLMLRGRP